jgi:hypothetical protein
MFHGVSVDLMDYFRYAPFDRKFGEQSLLKNNSRLTACPIASYPTSFGCRCPLSVADDGRQYHGKSEKDA